MDIDFQKLEKNELTDIRHVKIDRSLTQEERIKKYLEAVGNPYMVRVGNIKVKIRFSENGLTFEEAFLNMLRHAAIDHN